jgi:aspartyl protease family protein
MYVKQLLPLFVIAVAIGWFMPADNAREMKIGPENRPVQIIPASAGTQNPQSAFGDDRSNDIPQIAPDKITLSRSHDGHFYADLDVNYGKVRFLVDTGASMVALTGADAQKLGLTWNDVELETVARGASGDVRGKMVVLDKMQIGNFQANNVRAAIIPEGLDVSLLGQSFLARVSSVNIQNDKMVWN